MLYAVFVFYPYGNLRKNRARRRLVLYVHAHSQRAERKRAVHRPRIEIKNIEIFGEHFRHGAFSAAGRTVQRDIDFLSPKIFNAVFPLFLLDNASIILLFPYFVKLLRLFICFFPPESP